MKKEIEKIINIIETAMNLKIRGGRGYSAGHPYDANKIKPLHGKSEYDSDHEHQPDQEQKEPVQISRAFKGEDND